MTVRVRVGGATVLSVKVLTKIEVHICVLCVCVWLWAGYTITRERRINTSGCVKWLYLTHSEHDTHQSACQNLLPPHWFGFNQDCHSFMSLYLLPSPGGTRRRCARLSVLLWYSASAACVSASSESERVGLPLGNSI